MKMKKLLASALAAALVVSSMVGTIVTSAATKVGTITAKTVNVTVGQTDSVEAEVNITFDKGVVAPHNFITVALAGYELTDVALGDVTYATDAQGKVSIDKEYCDLDAGKILIEAPVDATAPTVTAITLTVIFTDVDDNDTAIGEYDIVVNADDMSDVDEADLTLDAVNGKLIVAAPPHTHTPAEAVVENNVAATCYAEGSYDSVVYCADETCKAELSRTPVTVEKIAHTPAEPVVENNVDATCYAEGSYDSVVYCAVEACKHEISRTPINVPVTDHTPAEPVVENNIDATCYAEGSYDSVVYCAVEACKHEISRTPVTVEKIAHTPAAPVEENRVEAKPGVAGSYDSVVYCAVEACKAEISRTTNEIPALPVEPDCDHTAVKVVSATPATAEAPEGSITYVCGDCDATVTETVKYNRFARANTRALVLEADISLTANVFERDLVRCNEAGANGVIDEYIVQFDEDRADADLYYAFSADAKPMTDPSNGRKYGMLPYGLRSVDMVNTVTMTVFAKVDGQWVTGEVYSDSVQTLANGLLSNAGTATTLKTLLVDMLLYGAAAQVNFGINTANLPSVAGYESFASTGSVSYANNRVMASSSTEAAPFTSTGISLELNSKILVRPSLQFGNKYYANYAAKYDGMKIVVSYTNFQGKVVEQEYKNVTVDPNGKYVFESTDGVRKFGLSMDIFTPCDLRQTYTIKAYTADGQLLNTDIISSVESDAIVIREANSSNTNLVNLLDAMMRYGDSAKIAFS